MTQVFCRPVFFIRLSDIQSSVAMLLLWRGFDIILGLRFLLRGRNRRGRCWGSWNWGLHLYLILRLPSIMWHICHAISFIFSHIHAIPVCLEHACFVAWHKEDISNRNMLVVLVIMFDSISITNSKNWSFYSDDGKFVSTRTSWIVYCFKIWPLNFTYMGKFVSRR